MEYVPGRILVKFSPEHPEEECKFTFAKFPEIRIMRYLKTIKAFSCACPEGMEQDYCRILSIQPGASYTKRIQRPEKGAVGVS
jgi:hypothetical protein